MTRVVLGLGSNIDREANIVSGLSCLRDGFTDIKLSHIYESPAVGFAGDNFFNLVLSAYTRLSLHELSRMLKDIEFRHGRLPSTPKYSSRFLDIDILTFADLVGQFGCLTLPRQDIVQRAYVLKPLADIEPELRHPELGQTYQQMWRDFEGDKGALWLADFQYGDGSTGDELR